MKTDRYEITNLCDALLLLRNASEVEAFLKDLCTPREIQELSERWKVCQLLYGGTLSYRKIKERSAASMTTIGRVARFLTIEPHGGYRTVLKRIARREKKAAG